ncbi:thioesterase domain-containing protein [Streptomyces sp. H-KF8]|uniref:thioesterase domain-containing protein n=1 Tax=Streptomyces sp. H-KF8 TaxID=1727216 RepID=UPI003B6363B9
MYAFDFVEEEHRIGLYADLIEREAPAGPLRLGGYSAGGNLAFEAARELERRGREVERIVLFDSAPLTGETDGTTTGRRRPGALPDRIRRHMQKGASVGPAARRGALGPGDPGDGRGPAGALHAVLDALVHTGAVRADLVLVTAGPTELGPREEDRANPHHGCGPRGAGFGPSLRDDVGPAHSNQCKTSGLHRRVTHRFRRQSSAPRSPFESKGDRERGREGSHGKGRRFEALSSAVVRAWSI